MYAYDTQATTLLVLGGGKMHSAILICVGHHLSRDVCVGGCETNTADVSFLPFEARCLCPVKERVRPALLLC